MLTEFFDNYAAYEYPLTTVQLFLAMLGMGALLTPKDFLLEVKNPRGLFVGLGFQWMLVPMIAFAALVSTPLLLKLLAADFLPDDFSMPVGSIALDILGALIAPLLLGMLFRFKSDALLAAHFAKWMIRLSMLMILIIVVGASGSGRLSFDKYGVTGIVTLVIFALLVQLSSLLAGKILGLAKGDTLAISVEATFRNIALVVAVKAIVFPAQTGVLDPIGDAVLFVAFLYGGISMFMTMVPVLLHRNLSKKTMVNIA